MATTTGSAVSQGNVRVGLDPVVIDVPRTSYNYGLLMVIALVIIALLIAVVVAFVIQSQQTHIEVVATNNDYNPLPLIPSVSNTVGAWSNGEYHQPTDGSALRDATACNANATSSWNIPLGRCECRTPYWGSDCQRETYSNNYISSGTVQSARLSVISQQSTTQLSFSTSTQHTCTNICDNQQECQGVLWRPTKRDDNTTPNCLLISGLSVDTSAQFQYDPNADSQVYFKTTYTPLITNSVFLYEGSLPIRYWLLDNDTQINSHLLQLRPDIVYTITWTPTAIINAGGLTGVYSTEPFVPTAVSSAISMSPIYYIHYPNTPLQIPAAWSGRQIWVTYRRTLAPQDGVADPTML